MQARDRAKF